MGKKSQFFRAFVEGQTISDGRTVTAEMIDEAVATFNVETYTPGINIEHLTGFSPQPPFNRYGDVVAVKAQTDDFTIAGKPEKRRALYAQVDALDQLVDLSASGQKPFPSVELTGDYAGTGKVGLIGLAFTDSPASIGTEKLKFSRSAPGTIFSTGAEGVAIAFEQDPADPDQAAGAIAGFFAALTAKFKASEPEAPPAKVEPPKVPANDNIDLGNFATEMGDAVQRSIAAALAPLAQANTALQSDFAALKTRLESTEQPGFGRRPATGASADAQFATDC